MKGIGVALVKNIQIVLDVLLGPNTMVERLSMADNWSQSLLELASKGCDVINHLRNMSVHIPLQKQIILTTSSSSWVAAMYGMSGSSMIQVASCTSEAHIKNVARVWYGPSDNANAKRWNFARVRICLVVPW
jgi:hypothetical protein